MREVPTAFISNSHFEYVRDLVYRHSGVCLDPGKEWLVHTRLYSLAAGMGASSVSEVLGLLRGRSQSELHERVVEALLTSETSFFRDVSPFSAVRQILLPKLLHGRPRGPLRIWCAACSSGQEPYSMAMLIREQFPDLPSSAVRILATDLSASMVRRAIRGQYSQMEVNRGLPAHLLVRYFTKDTNGWHIRPEIRQMVDFANLNLITDWPRMVDIDLVFLRNVLMYFDLATKHKVLQKVRELMRPTGYLFLGSAETIHPADALFESQRLPRGLCYTPADGDVLTKSTCQ